MGGATDGPAGRNPEVLYAYPVHVEAAVRAGRTDLAARPLAQFTAWAGAIGQRWAAAVAARCAALTADDADAEPLWRGGIAPPQGGGPPLVPARTPPLHRGGARSPTGPARAPAAPLPAAGP